MKRRNAYCTIQSDMVLQVTSDICSWGKFARHLRDSLEGDVEFAEPLCCGARRCAPYADAVHRGFFKTIRQCLAASRSGAGAIPAEGLSDAANLSLTMGQGRPGLVLSKSGSRARGVFYAVDLDGHQMD